MDKNTVWLVIIVLLVGIIAGMLVNTKITGNNVLTGSAVFAGKQAEIIQLGELDREELNRIEITEDNIICYIKLGQGAGISCVPIQE